MFQLIPQKLFLGILIRSSPTKLKKKVKQEEKKGREKTRKKTKLK